MSGVDVVLEELVLAEGGGADRALVRQVSRLQRLAVVLRHVVQQLPLVNLITRIGSDLRLQHERKTFYNKKPTLPQTGHLPLS